MANKNIPFAILKKRKDFDRLRDAGRVLKVSPWLIAVYRSNEVGVLRLGWTIPGHTGSAVTRNRIKRWIRGYLKQRVSITVADEKQSLDINLIFKSRAMSNKGKQFDSFFKKLKHEEVNVALDTVFFKLF